MKKQEEKIKKILITGSTGFVGKHLIKFIKKKTSFKILNPNKKKLNLLNKKRILIYLKKNKPNIVINLVSSTKFFQNQKLEKKNQFKNTYKTSVNLAQCLSNETSLALFVGSVDEYGNSIRPKTEIAITNPDSYYGKFKLKALLKVRKIFKKKKINFLWIRPSLIFGNGDNKNRFLGNILKNLKSKSFFKISIGKQIRDYLFIDDFCNIICLILSNTKIKYNCIINISSQNYVDLKDIPKKISKLLNKKLFYSIKKNNNNSIKILNNSKLRKMFPLYNFINFDDGLKQTLIREKLIN